TGPDGLEQRQNFRIAVRPAANPVAERRQFAIVAGETLRLPDPGQDGFGEDAVVSVTVGGGDVDSAGLLAMLDRFPYGCAEQTVSRALPLLYANDVAERIGLVADGDVPERINAAIDRLLSYQGSTGGFGLWAPGNDLWLTAYVMDFLSRAREAGYEVSDTAFEQGLNRLQSVLSFIGNIEGERSGEIAYATYVLARNGRAAIGDLRYFAQDQLEKFPTALARAQLAASLSFTGDQSLADGLFARALEAPSQRPGRLDYGTPLRDAAAIVTLAAESRAPQRTLAQLTRRVTAAATDAGERAYSTQEAAWLVLSANAAADTTGVAMVNGEEVGAPGTRAFDAAAMASGVSVQNVGQETLAIAATVTGTPLAPLPRVSNGLTITRSFHGLDGEEIDPSRVAQNTRIVVRLTVRKTRNAAMRIMLTDLLPAGFEVENPRLLSSADAAGVPMVQDGAEPEYREFRDDRFAAAWTLDQASDRPMTVSYMVRAISPGTFTLPAAEVVDMYQPAHVARTEAGTLSVVPTR
ncbi:MAG: alpha-2-macroglobulin family protein, partial [Pseudomonadota bacterium]